MDSSRWCRIVRRARAQLVEPMFKALQTCCICTAKWSLLYWRKKKTVTAYTGDSIVHCQIPPLGIYVDDFVIIRSRRLSTTLHRVQMNHWSG